LRYTFPEFRALPPEVTRVVRTRLFAAIKCLRNVNLRAGIGAESRAECCRLFAIVAESSDLFTTS
jgi:hypothetical protein